MSCICSCCIGTNCVASIVGQFAVASTNLCVSKSCETNYPQLCVKSTNVRGIIKTYYSATPIEVPNYQDNSTVIIIIVVMIAMTTLIMCINFCCLSPGAFGSEPLSPMTPGSPSNGATLMHMPGYRGPAITASHPLDSPDSESEDKDPTDKIIP
ncbi:hypothetical protein BC833DRAFT_579507 [Globomyces pollinis-pini]|nr:hypothetical protein BC833DRAFT_579507 [Globomyces pollinis-pini]